MTTINGFEQFAEELEDLAEDLDDMADEVDEAVDRGTGTTALQVEGSAKRGAPVDDGELRADIQAHRIEQAVWAIGTTKKYAPPMEYGSRPHPITPRGNYPLVFFWEKKGRWVATYEVSHPGTEPNPFLRPALNRHRSDLTENIAEEIEKLINSHR